MKDFLQYNLSSSRFRLTFSLSRSH
jgi:hypothetical protein